jgi:hypothetical protein
MTRCVAGRGHLNGNGLRAAFAGVRRAFTRAPGREESLAPRAL